MQSNEHEIRLEILRILESGDRKITQRDLARQLGVSLGKTNYCLAALAEKGWIRIQRFTNSPRKLRYAYTLTPRGIQERIRLTKDFLARKMSQYESIQGELKRLEQEITALQQALD